MFSKSFGCRNLPAFGTQTSVVFRGELTNAESCLCAPKMVSPLGERAVDAVLPPPCNDNDVYADDKKYNNNNNNKKHLFSNHTMALM